MVEETVKKLNTALYEISFITSKDDIKDLFQKDDKMFVILKKECFLTGKLTMFFNALFGPGKYILLKDNF